jgi:predicted MFS family arabinose efflux permease
VSALSAPVAAACCGLLFALSFLSIRRIRRPEPVAPRPAEGTGTRGRIREGVRFVAGQPWLRAVCLASAAFQFSFAAMTTVYLLFLPRELHLSGAAVGAALAVTGPGALLGSVLAARLPRRFGYGAVIVAAAALGDGAFLCVPALHGPPRVTLPALLAAGLLFGCGGQLVNVAVTAVRQAVTPAAMQGRAAATITFAGMGTAPLGSLLGGVLADGLGLRAALFATAAAMLLSPAVLALSPLRRLGRKLPEAVPERNP